MTLVANFHFYICFQMHVFPKDLAFYKVVHKKKSHDKFIHFVLEDGGTYVVSKLYSCTAGCILCSPKQGLVQANLPTLLSPYNCSCIIVYVCVLLSDMFPLVHIKYSIT